MPVKKAPGKVPKEEEQEKLYKFPTQDQAESSPTETPTDEETDSFKQLVAEWLKLDDQVRKLNVAMRERRTHQRALSTKVQDFMIKYGYDNLNTTQGVIKSNVRTVKQPLKMGDVRAQLDDIFNEAIGTVDNTAYTKFKEMVEGIFEGERPTVVKQSLCRRIPKVSMSLEL